jgi:hypothetical protein
VNEHALAAPRALTRRRARLADSPWMVAAVVAVVYAAFILPRLPGGVNGFAHVGKKFVTQGHSSSVINPSLASHKRIGYDGQFYLFLALDPVHAKDYMDKAGYRYSRIGYPALARGLTGGNSAAVPYALILINLAAIAAGTLAVAIWLRRRRVSPWYALFYGFFPGLVFSVFYDLAEPLAFALAAWGMVVFDRHSWRRLLGSACLFAYALLTRETLALVPLVMCLSILLEDGSISRWASTLRANLPRAAAFATVAFAPMFAWRLYVPYLLAGSGAGGGGGGSGISADAADPLSKEVIPLHGIIDLWPWNRQQAFVFATVIIPGVVTVLIALAVLLKRRSALAWLVLLSAAVFVVFIPSSQLINSGGASRAAAGVVFPLILAIPLFQEALGRRRKALGYTLLLWSLPFYALALIALSI